MISNIDPIPATVSSMDELIQAVNQRFDAVSQDFQGLSSSSNFSPPQPTTGGPGTGHIEGNAFSYSNPDVNVYDFLDPLFEAIRVAQLQLGQANMLLNSIGQGQLQVGSVIAGTIAANAVTTNTIAAGAVTAIKISVNTLSAIVANLGTITAGNITLDNSGFIRGGQTFYNSGSGFWLGYNSGAYQFSIGNGSTNYLTWNGTNIISQGGASPNYVIIDTTGLTVGLSGGKRVVLGTFSGNAASFNVYDSSGTDKFGIFVDGSDQPNWTMVNGTANANSISAQVRSDLTQGGDQIILKAGWGGGAQINSICNLFGGNFSLACTSSAGTLTLGSAIATTATLSCNGSNTFLVQNHLQMNGTLAVGGTTVNCQMQVSGTSTSNKYDAVLHRSRGGGNNNTGILFRNDFWSNNASAGMGAIYATDSGVSGGEVRIQTTRNGGGSTGTPADSLIVLNDGTLQFGVYDSSSAPATTGFITIKDLAGNTRRLLVG